MLFFFSGHSLRRQQIAAVMALLLIAQLVVAFQYKVGNLDSWGTPPPSHSNLYASWTLNHQFHIGDSLLFLYPPSQDSVVQVTERAFNTCSLANPILKMNDGNSIFKLTTPGSYYFTSGVPGHCENRQKLQVAVPDSNGTFFTPSSEAPGPMETADGPAYPLLFGPSSPEGSEAPWRLRASVVGGFAVVVFCCLF